MLESIYRRGGLKTGLFTSPHLVFQGERIQVNRQILNHELILQYTNELKETADTLAKKDADDHPTFFEFMTAMAFLHFQRESVEIGIFETGLGGRLDSTNVVNPEIAVITSISLDHVNILGDTIEKIAMEKGGIIKDKKPVVIGLLPREAEKVIREIAEARSAPVHSIRERFHGAVEYPRTNLHGVYQRYNAATATLVCELLREKFPLPENQVEEGLQTVKWPGRWEEHSIDSKTLILDSSHNPEGAEMLASNLEKLVHTTGRKPVVLAGTLGEFRAEVLMPVVARYAREIILLRPNQPRACTFQILEKYIPRDYEGKIRHAEVKDIFPFPGFCSAGEEGDTLVATGTIYLIGEILEALTHDLPVEEQILQDLP
jgi:dihydrofolate synthase/folylpolyglutamate synthase